ncbi:MAG: hypothetical protein ACRD0S_07230 [Acidimicrobiales bacterium]
MPSTIVWLVVAVAAGVLVGRALGHWSAVTGRLGRWLRDPTMPPPGVPSRDHPSHPPIRRSR